VIVPRPRAHSSTVHGLPSSTTATEAPAAQLPDAEQTSVPLHGSPSEHEVPAATGVCVAPRVGSHASTVHGFPSLTLAELSDKHWPVELHSSKPLQTLPSSHEMPA
jgi:hypothetical protein